MASIVISFVGNQDPISDDTSEEGSIVTLVRHLLAENCCINRVILLHTKTTKERAELTKGWLEDSPICLSSESIEIVPVDDALSQDPINLLLAAQSARKVIEQVIPHLTQQDKLEFNASSGTPVMKSSWSILQAAGYAPRSRIWQVRNPKEMQYGQPRVFLTNIDVLRNEFDIKVLKRQISDYNYSGALVTISETNFSDDTIKALLQYGHCRSNFDFSRAFSCIQPFQTSVNNQLIREISDLRQRQPAALLKELYFQALNKLSNRAYSDFLVLLFQFHECSLRFLVERELSFLLPTKMPETSNFWGKIKQFESGDLYKYLQSYRLKNGNSLSLKGFPNRLVTIAIVEKYPELEKLVIPLKEIEYYCEQRNQFVHRFEGVSAIEDEKLVLANLQKILRQITSIPNNPFDTLNQQISYLLDKNIDGIVKYSEN